MLPVESNAKSLKDLPEYLVVVLFLSIVLKFVDNNNWLDSPNNYMFIMPSVSIRSKLFYIFGWKKVLTIMFLFSI